MAALAGGLVVGLLARRGRAPLAYAAAAGVTAVLTASMDLHARRRRRHPERRRRHGGVAAGGGRRAAPGLTAAIRPGRDRRRSRRPA
jgi:hypothetical protein